MTNLTKRGGPKKLDGKERINSDIKINKISEPLFKNVSFEAKKIIEKSEGPGQTGESFIDPLIGRYHSV